VSSNSLECFGMANLIRDRLAEKMAFSDADMEGFAETFDRARDAQKAAAERINELIDEVHKWHDRAVSAGWTEGSE
jgi:hypothetical protein